MLRWLAIPAVIAVLLPALAAAQGGYDTDPTREQFVAQADPMCRDANKRSAALFAPVEKLVKKRKFKKAGSRLIRGERVQLRLVGELRELDRPPADASRIGKWLRIYEDGSRTVVDAGRDLKKKRVRSASAKLEAAEEIFTKSRRQVKDFGFRYCA